MKYNQFGHATDMPAEPPIEEHPFWTKRDTSSSSSSGEVGKMEEVSKHASEYRGMIKERKEWQKPKEQSFEEIFSEKR